MVETSWMTESEKVAHGLQVACTLVPHQLLEVPVLLSNGRIRPASNLVKRRNRQHIGAHGCDGTDDARYQDSA